MFTKYELCELHGILRSLFPGVEIPQEKLVKLALSLLHYGEYGLKPISNEEKSLLISLK